MLTNVLHTRRLCEKLVNLVAHIELLSGLEVMTRQFLPDPPKNLQRSCILCLACFIGNALLGIEDAALKNRRSTVAGEVARLNAMFNIDARDDGLAPLRVEWHSIWRLPNSETPVN